jgi:hypothetical protein
MPEMTGVSIDVCKRAEDGTRNAFAIEGTNHDTGDELDFTFDNWDKCRAKAAELQNEFPDLTIHLFDDNGVHRDIGSLPNGRDLPPSRPGITGPSDA